MNFKNTEFLYALLFLLIPVLIHFLNFFRTKKIYFSQVKLLKTVKENRNKVKEVSFWSVLVSRLLFYTFLVLTFLSLFFLNNQEGEKGYQVLFVDNSFSAGVNQNDQGETLLKEIVKNKISSSTSLVSYSDNSFSKRGDYFDLKENSLEDIQSLVLTSNQFSINKAIGRIEHLSDKYELDQKEMDITLVTDAQKEAFEELVTGDSLKWNIIRLESRATVGNLIIDSVWLENPFVFENEVTHVNVKYRQTGEVGNSTIKLLVDGKQVASSSASASSEVLDFAINLPDDKTQFDCSVLMDDNVVYDNEYYFTIHKAPSITISIISQDTSEHFIKRIYDNEPLFEAQLMDQGNVFGEYVLSSDLVILDGCKLTESLVFLLNSYISDKKGSMVYIPNSDNREEDLERFSALDRFGVIEAVYDTNKYEVKSPDSNPFFEGVFSGNAKKFDFIKSSRKLNLSNANGKVLLSYYDKYPYLLKNDGVYIFSEGFAPLNSTFKKSAMAIPIFYRMGILAAQINTTLGVRINDDITINGDFKTNDLVKLKNNDVEVVVDFSIGQNGELVIDGQANELSQGFYSVIINDSLTSRIAINLNKKESELAYYSDEELKKLFPNANISSVDTASLSELEMNNSTDMALWKYCLTLALFFLLIETVLINYIR